ncbi:exosome complex RNA-binding protein Rrp4 [Thermofilum pendens]|uniref:exosome complex RNA-binding protein Rrp4 n=1 Tax=Thermofilum pendens TaxID=2269 RepID=UPI00069C8F85|nr:exosome complex RNA-binding protein Rrp4 [Thermofilum pendens]
MTIHVKDRQIVAPGEFVGEQGRFRVEGQVFRVGRKYYSKVLGVVTVDEENRVVKVIPLKGKYFPVEGHIVVGKVVDIGFTSWEVDINSPYVAVLPVSEVTSRPVTISRNELSRILDVGDLILAKIVSFDLSKDPVLTIKESRLGKIPRGTLVEIPPQKVPRVIGRRGSMVSMIEDLLGVKLIVGQNGRIVVVGDDPQRVEIAVLAVRKIEAEAHTTGLTDRIKQFIEERLRS